MDKYFPEDNLYYKQLNFDYTFSDFLNLMADEKDQNLKNHPFFWSDSMKLSKVAEVFD